MPPRAPTSASIAESRAEAATVPQPSASQSRAAGGAITRSRPRSPSSRSRTRLAPAVPAAPVAAERVVAGRALEQVGQPGPRQVAAGERALGEHGRAQRLARLQAGDAQLADPARGGRRLLGAVHARPPARAASARRAARAAAGSSPAARGSAGRRPRPPPPVARRSEYGSTSISPTSRGASNPTSIQWRSSVSARSACQWVAGSPSSAANGRRSGNCE